MKTDLQKTAKKFKELTGFELFVFGPKSREGGYYVTAYIDQKHGGEIEIYDNIKRPTELEIFQAWNEFVKSLKPIEI